MTNLEALKALVNYPVSENSFKLHLLNRGLKDSDSYLTSNQRLLELASADCMKSLISQPDFTEGGYTLTLADRKAIIEYAEKIYKKYGLNSGLKNKFRFVNRW